MPENGVLMNPVDAKRLRLTDVVLVKVVGATNPAGEWDFCAEKKKLMIR